ncbi:L-fucose/L-arabinose isomerase family protein [Agrococcus baldri]|uniref:L-arabinose isomerase n=1 Tax=Agrococcus baldri TaxID=153730 RepID=A0AA87RGJ0_9MICO|nr:L-fucose/L-arabinose isomerase family protein [Agrococcus baldri]GEK79223.1 L-arabinose isomerase [Agrococcus baldri]
MTDRADTEASDTIASIAQALGGRPVRQPRVGLVSGGLAAYWPQFPELRPRIERTAARVAERLRDFDVELVDAGFISDETEGAEAGDRLRTADCDLVVVLLSTYLTSAMVLPIAQRAGAPVLVIDLQPSPAMDHASFDTGDWLAYCGQCAVPEVGSVFRRAGIAFRSVTGHLEDASAWARIERWIDAARVRAVLRRARHGLLGHLYPGMLDVSTDLALVSTQLGGHVEVLEIDDLRVRVEDVSEADARARVALARSVFTLDGSVDGDDLAWAARVSVGLDRLVDDFRLDSLAYYHRGLRGETHERVAAGMILGASLQTARGVAMAGEFELRNSIAMLVADTLGAGGSFTEIQALDFRGDVVEMGHDGPAHLLMGSAAPMLRGLGVFHGKRGWGVSVELDVREGPATAFGIGQERDGSYVFVASEGEVVPGPHLQIGNTTSRVDFGCHPGEWVDAWSASGVDHHWALASGHQAARLRATAELLGLEFRSVSA